MRVALHFRAGIAAALILASGCSPVAGLGASLVTLAAYERIQTGMSYEEVAAVMGSDGEEVSRTESSGHTIVMYSWKNSDGSNLVCLFQNGKLTSKSQIGLK